MNEQREVKTKIQKIEIGPGAKDSVLADVFKLIQQHPDFTENSKATCDDALLVDIRKALDVFEQKYRSELHSALSYEGKMAPKSFQSFQKLLLRNSKTYKKIKDDLLDQKREEAKKKSAEKDQKRSKKLTKSQL